MKLLILLLLFGPTSPKALLSWTSSNQVVLYRVHRGSHHGGPYKQIASGIQVTHWTDQTVISGRTYYYVVDCRNPVTNLVSRFSNEVKAVVP